MTRIIASDVVSLSHCPRRLWYEHNPPVGMEAVEPDPFETLIMEMGLEHERAVLDTIAAGAEVVEASSLDHTRSLMEQGVPVIYQAQLFDEAEQLFGKPDFLLLQDDGSYQAADAKLAHSISKEIGVQLAFYRRLLGNDHPGLAYLGTGGTEPVGSEFDAPLDTYINDARRLLADSARPEVRYSESKCTPCPFYTVCHPDFVAVEDLSLLYGVDSRSAGRLGELGIATISDLANADPADIPDDVPYLKGARRTRAVLQARAWKTGAMTKLNDIILPEGTWVHFDVEANPHTPDGHQHVYLWGFLEAPYEPENFTYVWTDHLEEDEAGWLAILAKVAEYRTRWPDLKLVHFAHYERGRISAYAKRYGMEEHDTVKWLLDKENGPLYDIQKAVTDNLVLPLSGYGLKNVCKHPDLVNFQWEDEESGSQWSVVQYIKFLRSEDAEERDAIKKSILGYNRDDVRATRKLEEWLRSL